MVRRKSGVLRAAAGGALVGAVNGLLGAGGGMLAVPVLRAGGLGTRKAHATAIAAVLPVCLVSGIVYLLNGFVPPAVLVPVSLGVAAGGAAGARLLARLPVRAVDLLFAAVMFLAGWRMLF